MLFYNSNKVLEYLIFVVLNIYLFRVYLSIICSCRVCFPEIYSFRVRFPNIFSFSVCFPKIYSFKNHFYNTYTLSASLDIYSFRAKTYIVMGLVFPIYITLGFISVTFIRLTVGNRSNTH